MSMNKVKLSQIINDFIITSDSDDYVNNVSDSAIRNFALRGIREIGFDLGKKIKSIKRTIDTTNDTVALPDDFVDLLKVGIVGDDGMVHVLNNNKHINYSSRITQVDSDDDGIVDSDTTFTSTSNTGPLNIDANLILNREPSKSSTTGATENSDDYDFYLFENYLHQGGLGRLYGVGGGYAVGEYRLNLDDNRIEIKMESSGSEVVLEYIADEARSTDPEVHVYAEEALRCYIYYKSIERKSSVPANEKARARSEFYNERRKANARLSNFTKQEALATIRRNFKQAPKY
tara:strand:- start:39 stop:905 length:867 start_codon:yes stop_codon:yes gene_type:complete